MEAVSISADGIIIPTTSVGNSSIFAEHAKNIIVEINVAQSEMLEGLHDIYDTGKQGKRKPIPLMNPDDRIGTIGIPFDPAKVKGIVFTNQMDSPSTIVAPDHETKQMADHLIDFLRVEVRAGRLTDKLAPLQAGIGSVANAVLHGMIDSEFKDLDVYSEVLQDSVFDLIDAGKVKSASAVQLLCQKTRCTRCMATSRSTVTNSLCDHRKSRITRKSFVASDSFQ